MMDTGNTSTNFDPRHLCTFKGCGKRFVRPEHLTRHTQSHYKTQTFVCEICEKEFSRSDSLRRHMKNSHGEVLKLTPSGNIKRACVSCKASSLKCADADKCSAYSNKSTPCVYEQQDVEMHDGDSSVIDERHTPASTDVPINNNNTNIASIDKILTANHTILTASLSKAFISKDRGVIDWTTFKIPSAFTGSNTSNSTAGYYTEAKVEDLITMSFIRQEYIDLYFTHFHHRWTILHHPVLDQHGVPSIVASAIFMIGSWLYGTQESKKTAIAIHENIMAQMILQLSQTPFYKSFPTASMPLYQASLLNIIFSLYCGQESLRFRASILRNILVAVLREIGLFNPATTYEDDKPGYFIVLKLSSQEARRRLAIYLFKIDSYLSILKDQPPQLHPEEFHFTLSSTYAAYNADGILEFEKRYALEPVLRSQKKIRNMFKDPQFSTSVPDHQLLIEDVTLCLCNMHPSIWQLSQNSKDSNADELSNTLERSSIRERLEGFKAKITGFHVVIENAKMRPQQYLEPLQYYRGREEETQEGWQDKVAARGQSLARDSLMLYHLLCMNLYTDIPLLRTVSLTLSNGDLSEVQKNKLNLVQEWRKTPDMRRSLWYASECISLFDNLRTDLSTTATGLEKDVLDPIAYIALSTAVLIFSTYCSFENCLTSASPAEGSEENYPSIDLDYFNTGTRKEHKREMWIARGGGLHVKYKGTKLCICSRDFVTTRFHSILPKEWAVPESLAP